MQLLKSAILTLLLVIALLFSFMLFKFDTEHALKLTARAYEQKDYQNAYETLQKIKKRKPAKAHLYEGYVLRAQKRWPAAQKAFEKAFKQADDPQEQKEASFNLLYTAYLQSDYTYIQDHLVQISQDLPYAQFFFGLYEYQAKNYDKAYRHFTKVGKPEFYSTWMKETWTQEFSKHWEISHRAHCLIEMGEIDQSRKLLEEHLDEPNFPSYFSYLLTLGYLKELQEKESLEDILTHFEKIASYLKPLSKDHQKGLLNSNRFSELCLPLWTTFLYKSSETSFDEWLHLQQSLALFESEHQAMILGTISNVLKDLPPLLFLKRAQKLASLPWDKEYLDELEKEHVNYLVQLVEDEHIDFLNHNTLALQKLISWTPEQKEVISNSITDQIYLLAYEAEDALAEIYNYLLFWDSFEREEEKRTLFLGQFLPVIKTLWPEDAKGAFQLAKWVDQFCHINQKSMVQESMLDFLQDPTLQADIQEVQEAYHYFNPLITR